MIENDLFDNGIDGEPWCESAEQEAADWMLYDNADGEYSLVHKSADLEVTSWPSYRNYVIETPSFFMYFYPGANVIEVYRILSKLSILTLQNQDLSLFGAKWDNEKGWTEFNTGTEIDKTISRYLNLKAFL